MTAPSRVIAVVGPPSAGASSLAAAVAERLPDHTVVEALGPTTPDAVVIVASAVAPLADSDVDLIERAAAGTDLVIAAVSKIDAHRGWREVLTADRALVARRDERYRQVPWVGVAAAPDLGEPDVDELVDTLRACLARPDLNQRNRLRASVFRGHRSSRSADALAVRGGIQKARLTLVYFVRRRCAAIGADLRAEAVELPRGATARFADRVRDAVADFDAELDLAIDEAIDATIRQVAGALALTPPPPSDAPPSPRLPLPRPSSRRLETRLMLVLGGGFGLGVALTLSRLTVQLGPGSDLIGLLVGGVVGLLLTIWVVGIRGVLHDRALMDRWVGEVTSTLRTCAEETVARRLLDTEIAFTNELAARDPAAAARSEIRPSAQ
ncbi:MAG: hypothetical protein QOH54_3153 [Mycobacterium sp.]|nr:hypothetical protein [Mycobacterium sp.]